MTNSILLGIKQAIGLDEFSNDFDKDVIMSANSVFFGLYQMGVGPSMPFTLIDETQTWDDFSNSEYSEAVPIYVSLKTKMLFDPPTNGTLLEALKANISELEWRINSEVDYGKGGA